MWARVDVGKLHSEVEDGRNANIALRRDLKALQQRCELAQATAVEGDSAMAKLHGQMAELRCLFDDRVKKLEESTSANCGLAAMVKKLQEALSHSKEWLMEEGAPQVDEKLK